MSEEIELTESEKWLASLNDEADQKAKEISAILDCEVKPFIFVIKDLEDSATGFFKVPDAKQSFKIFRMMLTDQDSGSEMAARAQLIREVGADNTMASDPRFMDVNGIYDKKDSGLNFSLILKAQSIVSFYQDQFKKK